MLQRLLPTVLAAAALNTRRRVNPNPICRNPNSIARWWLSLAGTGREHHVLLHLAIPPPAALPHRQCPGVRVRDGAAMAMVMASIIHHDCRRSSIVGGGHPLLLLLDGQKRPVQGSVWIGSIIEGAGPGGRRRRNWRRFHTCGNSAGFRILEFSRPALQRPGIARRIIKILAATRSGGGGGDSGRGGLKCGGVASSSSHGGYIRSYGFMDP